MKKGNNTNGNDNSNDNNYGKKQSDATLRADWLRRVMSHGLSPLEHKWLVRILQKKVRNPSGRENLDISLHGLRLTSFESSQSFDNLDGNWARVYHGP